jgi:hypothetical protein
MADQLDEIVKVVITRQTSAPAMASFSEHLVVDMFDPAGITPVFDTTHRVHVFGSASEVLAAGFASTSFIYRAASKQFAQSPHIGKIYVGMKLSTDADWTAALTTIINENNEWYALSVSARVMASQQECAEWAQANEKLLILASGDSNIPGATTGDIADWANTNNLDRVAVFYHPDCALTEGILSTADPIPEAAYFGKMLTKHPGSATWAMKGLQSVPTYNLTAAQRQTALEKNATIYTSVAGTPITSDGRVASGEYIDVIQGLDWLKARIQNMVFTPLVQQDKVPFTDSGIQTIVGQLRAALDEGVKYQILKSYDISAPTESEVPANDKSERMLPDVKFTAPLAGAIHRTAIDGTITL